MINKINPITKAIRSLRKGFLSIAIFSLVLNLLMLGAPLYMLQVYDRVLTSQNMDTLIALSLLLGGVFLVIGFLEFIRARILSRLGTRFELDAGVPILNASMRRKVQGSAKTGENVLSDVNAFRDFVSGSTLTAFFDLPWTPLYIAILFVLHPYLGLLGIGGTLFLVILAMFNSASSQDPMQHAAYSRARSDGLFTTCESNASVIQSMSMRQDLSHRWYELQAQAGHFKAIVTDRIATFSTISKTFRMALQSATLGVGAALTVTGQTSAGVMIAATIIIGRALAPIDQAIGQWRTLLAATASFRKLKKLALEFPEEKPKLRLPNAHVNLQVAIQKAAPPLAQTATLSKISFQLDAGDVMAVIGPSGSGKSTLAKMLAGIWFPQRGDVSLDMTPTSKWNKEQLGKAIGYLPQDVELFDGTIRENIARFATDVDDEKVFKAASEAGVHELIVSLPDAYETELGKDGMFLSGGQRQRIALARALYDDPFVVILDEPNSNLDAKGDSALRQAIHSLRARGAIAIVMTHRPSTLQAVNKVLVLGNGTQKDFGDREDVLGAASENTFEKSASRQLRKLKAPITGDRTSQTDTGLNPFKQNPLTQAGDLS